MSKQTDLVDFSQDAAADSAKLDGIAAGATVDHTPAYASIYSTAHHTGTGHWLINAWHTGPNGSLVEGVTHSVDRLKIVSAGVYHMHMRGWDVYTNGSYINDGYRFTLNGTALSHQNQYTRATQSQHYSDFSFATTMRLAVDDLVGVKGLGADSGIHVGVNSAFTITKVSN